MKTSERTVLKGYYFTHDAIRKDMQRLRTVESKFSSYGAEDFKKIYTWFKYHGKAIFIHHHGEDEFFFPMINECAPEFKQQIETLEEEHRALDKQMAVMNILFERLGNGEKINEEEFRAEAEKYANLIIRHLDAEEKVVDYVQKKYIPDAEMLQIEGKYVKMMPKENLQLMLPWMVDVMEPSDKKLFFSKIPFFVKWIYELKVKKDFIKMVGVI
ncbi:MAG: hemerythrin domain-containing protein [Chitinophagales bacterium]|nr:hemerythrin domain-containing protein [Chitinophagales bacterium]